jgi:hypothetical protein
MGDYDAVQKDAALVNQTFDNNKSTIALVLESEVKNHVFKDKVWIWCCFLVDYLGIF